MADSINAKMATERAKNRAHVQTVKKQVETDSRQKLADFQAGIDAIKRELQKDSADYKAGLAAGQLETRILQSRQDRKSRISVEDISQVDRVDTKTSEYERLLIKSRQDRRERIANAYKK